jgi:hypothetical protein
VKLIKKAIKKFLADNTKELKNSFLNDYKEIWN